MSAMSSRPTAWRVRWTASRAPLKPAPTIAIDGARVMSNVSRRIGGRRSRRTSGWRSRRLQGLVEVADQVRSVLDADGEPHKLRGDPRGATQRLGDRGVAHRPGMADEALDAAERLGECEVPDSLERPHRPFGIALDEERHHASAAAHLPRRKVMLRMACKARVIYALDLRVTLEKAREFQRVRHMALHAERQRP